MPHVTSFQFSKNCQTASPSLKAFRLIISIIISDLAAIDYLMRVSTLVSEQGLTSSEEILVPQ